MGEYLFIPLMCTLVLLAGSIYSNAIGEVQGIPIVDTREQSKTHYTHYLPLPFSFEVNVLGNAIRDEQGILKTGLFSLNYRNRPLALWKIENGSMKNVNYLIPLPNQEYFEKTMEYFLNKKESDLTLLSFEEELKFYDKKRIDNQNADEALIRLCGGKGASLALNTHLPNIDTPIGASVSTEFYFQFLDANPELKSEIQDLLESFDAQNALDRESLESEIQGKILQGHVPVELLNKMNAYYTIFNLYSFLNDKGESAELAVRSSGVSEDMKVESWIPLSSGSQAGQGDSFLDVKGYDAIMENTKKVWASLFNDRALQYRDDQAFIQWTSELGKNTFDAKYAYYLLIDFLDEDAKKLSDDERGALILMVSENLKDFSNPGTRNLKSAFEILHQDKKYTPYMEALMISRELISNPSKLGMGVVIMEMCKSHCSGVGFTVHTGTKNYGLARAIDSFKKGKSSLIEKNSETNKLFIKPLVVEFEVNWGYGESVVAGKVNPDRYLMASCDGDKWFLIDKKIGSKQVQTLSTHSVLEKSKELFGIEKEEVLNLAKGDSNDSSNLAKYVGLNEGYLSSCSEPDYVNILNSLFPNDNKENAKRSFLNFAHLVRSINKKDFTTEFYSSDEQKESFVLSDHDAEKIAKMIAYTAKNRGDSLIDIEFGIEKTFNGEFSFEPEYNLKGDSVSSKAHGRLINLQTRPYTGEVLGVSYSRSVTELDLGFVRGNKILPIAYGTRGESATWGYVYTPSNELSLPNQISEIKRLQEGDFTEKEKEGLLANGVNLNLLLNSDTSLPIILYLEEAEPKHNPLMQEVKKGGAVLTNKGGETSHAAIYTREQRIPACCGIGEARISSGDLIVIDANNGRVYPYDIAAPIPLSKHSSELYPYLIPSEVQDKDAVKIGYIVASEHTASHISPTLLAPDAGGISLARAEFKAMDTGINPFAGYGYDLIQSMNLDLKEKETWKLSSREELVSKSKEKGVSIDIQDAGILEKMLTHSWIESDVEAVLKNAGYKTYKKFIYEAFLQFYRHLGFTVGESQVNKSRAYDFSQDKVQGLIGSEVFSWPGVNPLVGLRGAALEIKGVNEKSQGNQKVLGSLFDAIIDANRDTSNQGWFYVFIRSLNELDTICNIIERKAQDSGHLPKQIGIMVEIPSNALFAKEMCAKLSDLEVHLNQMKSNESLSGYESLFISFGTNDYTNLAGKTDREDPRIQMAKIIDPLAIESIKEGQKFHPVYKEINGDLIVPSAYEGSDGVLALIESFVKESKDAGISSSLCGQAIVNLIEQGNNEAASRIISVLDSFGVDIKNRLKASMLRYDTLRMNECLMSEPSSKAHSLSESTLSQEKGILSGGILHLKELDDLRPIISLSDEHAVWSAIINEEYEKLSPVYGKIILIDENSPSIESFKSQSLPWDHLKYAKAIIMKQGVDNSYFNDPMLTSRIKLTADDASFNKMISSKEVTLDFANKVFYQEFLEAKKTTDNVELKSLYFPPQDSPFKNEIDLSSFGKSDANSIYENMGIHPLLILNADEGNLTEKYKAELIEKIMPFIKELSALQLGEVTNRSTWQLDQKRREIRSRFDALLAKKIFSHTDTQDFLSSSHEAIAFAVADNYLSQLEELLKLELNGRDGSAYLKEKFLQEFGYKNTSTGLLHQMTSLNPASLNQLFGGSFFEEVSMNPDYGYLGPIRALGDFWKLNHIELKALNEFSKENKSPLYAQIRELKGVQTEAILEAYLKVSESEGILSKNNIEFILDLSSPSNVISVKNYALLGIKNFSFNKDILSAAWLGADIYWKEGFKDFIDQDSMDMVAERSERIIFKFLMESKKDVNLMNF